MVSDRGGEALETKHEQLQIEIDPAETPAADRCAAHVDGALEGVASLWSWRVQGSVLGRRAALQCPARARDTPAAARAPAPEDSKFLQPRRRKVLKASVLYEKVCHQVGRLSFPHQLRDKSAQRVCLRVVMQQLVP